MIDVRRFLQINYPETYDAVLVLFLIVTRKYMCRTQCSKQI